MDNQKLIEYLKKLENERKKYYRLSNESDVDYRNRMLIFKKNIQKLEDKNNGQ